MGETRSVLDRAVDLYADAVSYDAIAEWDSDEGAKAVADVAWSRYDATKVLIGKVLGIEDEEVDALVHEKMIGKHYCA